MRVFRKLRQQNGFTLVEVITVVVLMSLLISFAMPMIQHSVVRFQMDAAIIQLHKDIRWAQRLADQQQKAVNINFLRISPAYQYWIAVSGSGVYLKKVSLPAGLTKMTAQSIIIEPDKTFRKNGHVLIQKGDVSRYVYYYQTGRSRVSSVPG